MVTNATHTIQEQLVQGAQLFEEAMQLWMKALHHPMLQHAQWELTQSEDALDRLRASTHPPDHAQRLAAMHQIEDLHHSNKIA